MRVALAARRMADEDGIAAAVSHLEQGLGSVPGLTQGVGSARGSDQAGKSVEQPPQEGSPIQRSDVTFESDGTVCAAWLYRPDGQGETPCVVLAHGFGAVRELRLDAYAERFAAAGLAALVFDYRHFGGSGGEPRQLIDVGWQLEDWRAAIAYARELDGIDSRRIALWGTSFSGGHVVAVAATDERIAAVVSQVPFTDGISAARAVGLRQFAASHGGCAARRVQGAARPLTALHTNRRAARVTRGTDRARRPGGSRGDDATQL